jgi:hypothetical protein
MLTLNGSPATPTTLTGPASVCPSSSGHVYSTTPVTGATTYLWTVPTGASIVSGNGSNTITVNWGTVAGSVTVKAGNTCSNYSTAKTLTVGLATCRMGEEEVPASDPSVFANIRLYPNPLNNFLTMEINANETTTKTIRVTDMLGKILIEEVKVVTSGQNTFMFDLSGYASGLYMVILNSSNSQQVFKVVKE